MLFPITTPCFSLFVLYVSYHETQPGNQGSPPTPSRADFFFLEPPVGSRLPAYTIRAGVFSRFFRDGHLRKTQLFLVLSGFFATCYFCPSRKSVFLVKLALVLSLPPVSPSFWEPPLRMLLFFPPRLISTRCLAWFFFSPPSHELLITPPLDFCTNPLFLRVRWTQIRVFAPYLPQSLFLCPRTVTVFQTPDFIPVSFRTQRWSARESRASGSPQPHIKRECPLISLFIPLFSSWQFLVKQGMPPISFFFAWEPFSDPSGFPLLPSSLADSITTTDREISTGLECSPHSSSVPGFCLA